MSLCLIDEKQLNKLTLINFTSVLYTQFKIYEGEFASDKCYQTQDLEDLKYYLQRYNSAIFSQNAAARSSKITCNGSDFFKDNCDRAKQQYDQALKDQETYKAQIQAILGKGT